MKTLIFLFLIMFVSATNHANVWRLNNLPGTDAHFTSLQEAHDDFFVEDGDTLYLEASSGSYGDLIAEKKLVIIGSGYFTAENLHSQADIKPSKVTDITFNDGSQGSVISGCQIRHVIVNTSDIVIERNYITSEEGNNHLILLNDNEGNNYINNITIRNNFLLNTNTHTGALYGRKYARCITAEADGINNVVIKNNYIYVMIHDDKYALNLREGFSGVIENNAIHGNVVVHNASFNNNILRDGDFEKFNTTWMHNLANETQFGGEYGNQQMVNMEDVFEGTGSTDGMWMLKEGSPAIGAGLDGVDCGMYGGERPYILSGIPAIPAIYKLEMDVDNVNQQIEVEMSIKSRD